jgi:hypothetical protein
MSSFNAVYAHLEAQRNRAISGKYNCIPFPFNRFRNLLPGTQMGKYIIVTAAQKIGKTKFCDFVYVYETIFFIIEHPEVRAKIFYFCLEESPKKKYIEFLSHLLYRLDKIVLTNTDLESVNKDKPLDPHILELLKTEKYQKYIKKFEETVRYIEDTKNPTGINKICREYALSHGHLNYKEIDYKDIDGSIIKKKVVDSVNPYTPNDPEEYKIVILDNASNLTQESGLNKRETIEKLSKYAITLRDQLNYTFILIQHQAQNLEDNESFKLDRMKPRSDSIADCKTTVRDVNMVIGLYSPFKFNKETYEKYDITKLRNHARFMEVLEDRDYGSNGNICPLYFDGATSFFSELPRADDTLAMNKIYKYLEDKKLKANKVSLLAFAITNKLNKILNYGKN